MDLPRLNSFKTIKCRVQFINFGTVNVIDEVYRASIVVKSRWQDSAKITKYDPEKHWNPRLYIENGQTIPSVNWIEDITYKCVEFKEYTEIIETRCITGGEFKL